MKFDDYMYIVKGPELKVKQPSIQKKPYDLLPDKQ